MDKAPNGKDKVVVKLVGEDGNAFSILGRVRNAMRKAQWTSQEIEEYTKKAQSGDYNNLLRVTMEYVEEPEEEEDEDSDLFDDDPNYVEDDDE